MRATTGMGSSLSHLNVNRVAAGALSRRDRLVACDPSIGETSMPRRGFSAMPWLSHPGMRREAFSEGLRQGEPEGKRLGWMEMPVGDPAAGSPGRRET